MPAHLEDSFLVMPYLTLLNFLNEWTTEMVPGGLKFREINSYPWWWYLHYCSTKQQLPMLQQNWHFIAVLLHGEHAVMFQQRWPCNIAVQQHWTFLTMNQLCRKLPIAAKVNNIGFVRVVETFLRVQHAINSCIPLAILQEHCVFVGMISLPTTSQTCLYAPRYGQTSQGQRLLWAVIGRMLYTTRTWKNECVVTVIPPMRLMQVNLQLMLKPDWQDVD